MNKLEQVFDIVCATVVQFSKLILCALPWALILWLFCNKVLIPCTYFCWIDTSYIHFYQALLTILMFHMVVKIIKKGIY